MSRVISYNDGQTTKSDLVLFGTDGLIVQDPGELNTDRYGLSTITTVWRAPADYPEGSWPQIFSSHPLHGWAQLDRRRVSIQGGQTIITGEYAGVENGTSDSVFELTVGVQDEPIVSHPQFVSAIGGKPSSPLNGAVFLDPDGVITTNDEIGQFAYFKVGSSFAGIESYLAADFITWRQRYCTNFLILNNDIGHISTPSGPWISPSNWIKISSNVERRGAAFMVCHEWRAGGRRGWNSTIYA